MPNPFYIFLYFFVLVAGTCGAESANYSVRYMADSQDYVDAINNGNPTNTLVASNLLLMQQLGTIYHHDYASLARIQHFMDQGEAVCVANKLKTDERAQKYLLSHPVNLHLSHLLYQLAIKPAISSAVLTEQGEVSSLNSLFADLPKQTILIPYQRSFGTMLDEQIAVLPEINKLIYQGGDLHESEIDMFVKQRGDFLLTYPATIFANHKSLGDNTIRSYAIANNPKYTVSRVMCSDTPATRTHIEQINQALKVLYSQAELLNVHLKWAPPVVHEQIKTYYQQVTQEFRQTSH